MFLMIAVHMVIINENRSTSVAFTKCAKMALMCSPMYFAMVNILYVINEIVCAHNGSHLTST